MEKDMQRIQAVKDNDIRLLKSLADDTDWYKYVDPETGNTFLHTAVASVKELRSYNREIFYYLVEIVDFPLDHKNNDDQAVLELCLNRCGTSLHDEFACELIRKGASLDCVFLRNGDTLLHHVAKRSFIEVSKLLVNMGYDINARNRHGETPLWCCLHGYCVINSPREEELVTYFLYSGADPTQGPWPYYNPLEYAIKYKRYCVQRDLFQFMYDRNIFMDIHIEILLMLSTQRSILFHQVVNCTKNVIVTVLSFDYNHDLFLINRQHLRVLVRKFPNAIKKILNGTKDFFFPNSEFPDYRILENVNVLLESDLKYDVIDFIHSNSYGFLLENVIDISFASENPYFFLSNGIRLEFYHLSGFYLKFGLDELLTLVLNTDIELNISKRYIRYPILMFLSDLHADLNHIFRFASEYYDVNVGDLLHYFAHPRLREICSHDKRPEVAAKIASQPQLPTLLELARTASRRSLARTFTLTTTSEFYRLVNRLPIPTVLKKVLTFEKKLY